jgi:hypothetical protein
MTSSTQYRPFLAEHLPYEWAMMSHTLSRLDNAGSADWNAFMESFCLHVRNLKHFVTNDDDNRNVVARDFVSSFDRKTPSNLTGAFQRLDSQTAHLAKTRTTVEEKKFTLSNAKSVFDWLNIAMSEFVQSLSPEDQSHWASAFRLYVPTTLGTQTASSVFTTTAYTSNFRKHDDR